MQTNDNSNDNPPPIRRLNPPGTFDPTDLGFSSVVVVEAGAAVVHIAGKLADDQRADFATQVDQAFENLRVALEAGGASLNTVVAVTCLIVDADDDRIATVSAARRHHFGDHRPTSTIIPVPRLAGPTALFEIDAVAVVA